jgi:outer membrane protein
MMKSGRTFLTGTVAVAIAAAALAVSRAQHAPQRLPLPSEFASPSPVLPNPTGPETAQRSVLAANTVATNNGQLIRLPPISESFRESLVLNSPAVAAQSPSASAPLQTAPPRTSYLPTAPARAAQPAGSSPVAQYDWAAPTAPHGNAYLQPYQQRALHSGQTADTEPVFDTGAEIPDNFQPWWSASVGRSLRGSATPYQVDVGTLVVRALQNSPRVRAISDIYLIRETQIVEAASEFDVRAFMDSKFSRDSNPVGNTLTTGGAPRFRDLNWHYNGGLRKKSALGGTMELSQRVGLQDNNSIFFVPDQQGTSKLSLSYTQPLLNGAGRAYNNSLTLLAQIDAGIAENQTSEQLQDHLLKVTESYWELYLQRTALVQKQRNLERGQAILSELEARRGIDALESQIAQARAAVAMRRAELIRAAAGIRNVEAVIRARVNAPELSQGGNLELLPFEQPIRQQIDVNLQDALLTAVQNRPEVDESMKQMRAGSVRMNMAENELLPALNLVLATYVTGLRGDTDIAGSLADQFSVGEPSYSAGLLFEVPLNNRAAKARYQRRKLELRQLTSEFQQTVETLMAEVEVSVRDVNTAYREMQAKYASMVAADEGVRYLLDRWRLLPGDDRSASFLLQDLLDAQDRLVTEEFGFAQAQFAYTVALANLKRTTGTLLQAEQITPRTVVENGVPRMIFEKAGADEIPSTVLPPGTRMMPNRPTEADSRRYPLPSR